MGDLSTNPQPTAHAAATHTAKPSVYPGGEGARCGGAIHGRIDRRCNFKPNFTIPNGSGKTTISPRAFQRTPNHRVIRWPIACGNIATR
ncbi:hypothetical protein [Burkholderia contaminans]|nr:hypothetical protein [Burkholderia contaminans]